MGTLIIPDAWRQKNSVPITTHPSFSKFPVNTKVTYYHARAVVRAHYMKDGQPKIELQCESYPFPRVKFANPYNPHLTIGWE